MTTPTNPHPFAPTEELFRNILDLVKLVIPTGDSENAEKANTLLGLAERHLKETSDAFQLQQQQIAELTGKALAEDSHNQHKLVEDLRKKVTAVDNQLSKAKKDSYSSQISGTKDNILVRSTKDSKAVSEYIGLTIRRYDKNVKLPDFSVHLISSSRDAAKTPNKSATRFVKDKISDKSSGTVPSSLLYKVYMGPYYKDLLFKGLATGRDTRLAKNEKSDFSISHDTPLFLRKNKNTLEQCAYSLRKSLKERYDIRTKVVLKDHNLKLFYNTKDSRTWVPVISSSATGDVHQMVQDTLYVSTNEGDAPGTRKVPEVIASLSTY